MIGLKYTLVISIFLLLWVVLDSLDMLGMLANRGFPMVQGPTVQTVDPMDWSVRSGYVYSTIMMVELATLFCWVWIPSLIVIVAGMKATEIIPAIVDFIRCKNGTVRRFALLLLRPVMNVTGSLFLIYYYVEYAQNYSLG